MAQAATIDVLVSAIYDLQRQIYNLTANRSREPSFGGYGPYAGYGRQDGAGPSSASPLYGMPGYGVMSFAPSTSAIIVHSTATSQPVPITHIQFPSSPSTTLPLPPLLHGRVLPAPERVLRASLRRGVWHVLV
jgi:hypothetical protein